jgi:hypothetical protein
MSEIVEIINKLPGLDILEPTDSIREDIQKAEEELELSFAEEYKEYVSTFGEISCERLELTGISKNDVNNVVEMTFINRDTNPEVPSDLYVIQDMAIGGIVYWQDSSGTIYVTEYEDPPEVVAGSLVEFLRDFKECFKKKDDEE